VPREWFAGTRLAHKAVDGPWCVTPLTPGDKKLYQRHIEVTDAEIDAPVYELYGLREEEIAAVRKASSAKRAGCSMIQPWSDPVPYDLSRTPRRASVPRGFSKSVPETPGTYVVYRIGQANPCEAIIDIGEAGPRARSTPKGLRGRLATAVAHAASKKIAADVGDGRLRDELRVVWVERQSKEDAKELQDALISLFRQECGRQPRYNTRVEKHPHPELFAPAYADLKRHIGCLLRRPITRRS
jgi:hypothetical protein